VQIFTPYGATEALPVANIGSNELLATKELTESGRGTCIGRPVPGMTVHVLPISDDAIPEFRDSMCLPAGQIGEFVVRGPVVTKRYLSAEATRFAKIHDPATGETLHRMGDVGYFDEQGRLWFCGRKSQRVVTANGALYTDQVEPIFNSMDLFWRGDRTALVGVKLNDEIVPVVCFERCHCRVFFYFPNFDEREQERQEIQECAKRFAMTERITIFLRYDRCFPVDPRHNSKINREKLAVWAAEQFKKSPPVATGGLSATIKS
jgi:acyl-CoA synthetase (AMP-forming)/AMP-acid ligase II